jgi:tetratricopeptide (TPR) repeat protein
VIVMDAVELMNKGRELMHAEKYSEAASSFRRAACIFAEQQMINEEREASALETEAGRLLKEQQARLAALQDAIDEEARGKSCFVLMQLGEAAAAFKSARDMFDAIDDSEGSKRCELAREQAVSAISGLKEKTTRIARANEFYSQGCQNIVAGNLAVARKNLGDALQLFQLAEHEPGIELVTSALETLEAKIQAGSVKEKLLAGARTLADIADQMLVNHKDHKLEDIISAMNDAAKAYEEAGEYDLEMAMRSQMQQLRNQAKSEEERAFLRQRAIDKEAVADAKYASSLFNDALGMYIELCSEYGAVNDVNGVGRVTSGATKCRRGLLVECIKQLNEELVAFTLQVVAEEPEEWSDVHDDEVSVTSGSKVLTRFPSTTTTRAVSLIEASPAVCCNELWPMPDRVTWDPVLSSFSVLEMIDEHSEIGQAIVDVGAAYEKRSLIVVRHKRMSPDGRFVLLEYSLPLEHMHYLYPDHSRGDARSGSDVEAGAASVTKVTSADPSGLFGSLFHFDEFEDKENPPIEIPESVKPSQPQIHLWAEVVCRMDNDFRSTVHVIRSSDFIIGGGGLLGSVLSAVKNLVSANPSHTVARAIAIKYARNALLGLFRDADTLLSLGAFDEALQKYASCLTLFPDELTTCSDTRTLKSDPKLSKTAIAYFAPTRASQIVCAERIAW